MSKPKSNNAKTISVALTLCLVCSVLVSAVAVGLKPAQIENARLDRNKNILVAADMYNTESDTADDVAERFKDFDVKIIDLNKGNYLDDDELKTAGIPDRNAYDASQATKNQALSEDLGDNDPAGIGRKPKYAKVYVKEDDAGKPELVVLPIQGVLVLAVSQNTPKSMLKKMTQANLNWLYCLFKAMGYGVRFMVS